MKRLGHIVLLTLAAAGCATTDFSVHHKPTAAWLAKIEIPEIDFRNAAMSDVVDFMAISWHCICHPMTYAKQEIHGDSVTYSFHIDFYDPHDPNSRPVGIKGTNETQMVLVDGPYHVIAQAVGIAWIVL